MVQRIRSRTRHGGLEVRLSGSSRQGRQGEEWCLVRQDQGEWREIKFHDYAAIFKIPGLYEHLFHDLLRCQSPAVVRRLLEEEVDREGGERTHLRVLDVGAGNGLMAEELSDWGVGFTVGVDILPEAAEAAHRDRTGVYKDYHVLDLAHLSPGERDALRESTFNVLTCVAALGFADIPPRAFREAYNSIVPGGWVAITLKEEFLQGDDRSGYCRLIRDLSGSGALEVRTSRRYLHRLGARGEAYHYVAMTGKKVHDA